MDETDPNNLTLVLFIGMIGMFILAFTIVYFVLVYKKSMVDQELLYQQNMIQKAIDIQEDERKRFAADLHDQIGGGISAVLLSTSSLDDENATRDQHDKLENIREQLTTLLGNVRRISYNITPDILETYGLTSSLSDLYHSIELSGGIQIELTVNGIEERLPFSNELAIYRICMEMLTNTIKHARASQIDVVIEHTENYFELHYRDNGIGFNPNEPKTGMGMNNMINRALFLGAEFKMDGKLDKGISAKLKLKKD